MTSVLDILLNCRLLFVIASVAYGSWLLAKSCAVSRVEQKAPCSWAGRFGLISGVASGGAFLFFYVSWLITKDFFIHGSALWLFDLTFLALALTGLIAALAVVKPVCIPAAAVCFVMVFQWSTEVVSGAHSRRLVTFWMFVSLATFVVARYGARSISRAGAIFHRGN